MSVNTKVKDGVLHNLGVDVKILDIDTGKEVNYNPGLCRDPKGNLWISIRSCIHNPDRWEGWEHPNHYQNFLSIGILDEKTLKIKDLKEVVPEEEYPGFQWGIEDVRLFWRKDGLHGIGVSIPIDKGGYAIRQAEILIDYEKGTYRLIKDHGRPFGHQEKNWSPSESPNPYFDFIYSPTQIVKDGEVIGEMNDLFIHNGTPLIPYENGYLSVGHVVTQVHQERTYAQIALKWDKTGKLIEHSQFFHFNVGWRENLEETIEFVSGMVWDKKKENLIVGIGVKDEITGIAVVSPDKFKWEPYEDATWYAWNWDSPPNREELPTPEPTKGLACRHTALSRPQA